MGSCRTGNFPFVIDDRQSQANRQFIINAIAAGSGINQRRVQIRRQGRLGVNKFVIAGVIADFNRDGWPDFDQQLPPATSSGCRRAGQETRSQQLA